MSLGPSRGSMNSPIVLLALALTVASADSQGDTTAESCSVLAGAPPVSIASPEIRVISLRAADTFLLPADLPSGVRVVVCERETLVPAEFDYKVLLAGYPFVIRVSGGMLLWLERENGQVRVSFGEGGISDEQASQIQEWVDRVQPNFHKEELYGDKDGP